MLDIADMREVFAKYLIQNYHNSKSLDAALMHVIERAYQQGLKDAEQKPEPTYQD